MTSRIILITGSNKGLGNATGLELCRLGHSVIFTARNINSLDATKLICLEKKYTADFYELDVSHLASINKLKVNLSKKYNYIDTLINNAGILIDRNESICSNSHNQTMMSLEQLNQTVQTNLIGPIMMIRSFADMIKKSSNGIIVNFSSVLGSLSEMGSGMPSYRITKSALNAVTKICASELEGIKVNSIHPGWVKTDMGGEQASLTIEEAIPGIVWAATLDKNGPSGKFFFNKKEIPW